VGRIARHPSAQVLVAIALGVALGQFRPDAGIAMRPLGDTFVALVRMVIAPIIFLTIVLGIAGSGDLRQAGRVGVKALVYFEVVTTLALALGLLVANVLQPGAGLDPTKLPHGDTSAYVTPASEHASGSIVSIVTHIVPSSIVDAFARGDVLQVVFVAILIGIAIAAIGEPARPLLAVIDATSRVMFRVVRYIMYVAPIGAFGAMAYTVGTFGLAALRPLARLMADVYLTMGLFVFVVLGLIARAAGFRIVRYLAYIKDEILLVLGTSSSEAGLPGLMDKLERMGCPPSIVRLVVPAGYSFNLDGTSIYLSMAVLFIAQAYGIHLTIAQQLATLALLMLTSKGAAGVTGSGFIVLASTLGATKLVPVEGVALILGVDRFMSEARAIVNLIGNGVATIVVSRAEQPNGWEVQLQHDGA
jgi:aerobic C4-dicarboxylate transport protein